MEGGSKLVINFDRMRRKRNDATNEAGSLITVSETKKAFQDASLMVKEILNYIKKKNPQLELDMNLG